MKMKVSDAILLGGTNFTPMKGMLFYKNDDGVIHVCAMGSALHAMGFIKEDTVSYTLSMMTNDFPFLLRTHVTFEEIKKALQESGLSQKVNTRAFNINSHQSLYSFIAELNDFCDFTFAETASVIRVLEDMHPEWYEENKENNGDTVQTEQLENQAVAS